MHSIEQQNAFIFLRANGWSLGKISEKLDLPKSTLFHWECEHRAQIHVMKSMQVEKLQEKYAPSYEEELQYLASYLARVERALQQHAFDQMRPEFLLHTALHLRARLNKLRTDVPLNASAQQAGLEPLPVGGCISRAEKPVLVPDYEFPDAPIPCQEQATDSPSPPLEERAGERRPTSFEHGRTEELCLTAAADEPLNGRFNGVSDRKSENQNGTFSHENGVGSKLDASTSETSNTQNGTPVPFPNHERIAS